MAERVQERELVFCYACENEWHRDEHGLECPSCHSDIVEIVSPAMPLPKAVLCGYASVIRSVANALLPPRLMPVPILDIFTST